MRRALQALASACFLAALLGATAAFAQPGAGPSSKFNTEQIGRAHV